MFIRPVPAGIPIMTLKTACATVRVTEVTSVQKWVNAVCGYTFFKHAGLVVVLYAWGIAQTQGSGVNEHAARGAPLPVIEVPTRDERAIPLVKFNYRTVDTLPGDLVVSNLYRSNRPYDLRKPNSVSERKRLFIKLMMPLVLRANDRVLEKRRRLLQIERRQVAGLTVSAEDTGWIAALAEEYGLPHVGLDVLKRHVDIVPPSLALAQSAEESGWGTSRFAIEGNALFGQRIYRGDKGMVPLRRDPDKQHRVCQFDHPQESVSRYLHNLNTHWAYDMFRDLRARMRSENQRLDSSQLVGTLAKYSERGAAYIETIRSIISFNGLTDFDQAELFGERI